MKTQNCLVIAVLLFVSLIKGNALASEYTFKAKTLDLASGDGLFVAVREGRQDSFDALAVGWMAKLDDNSDSQWRLGVGLVVEGDFKRFNNKAKLNLQDDFVARQGGGSGLILMTSFAF